MFLTQSTQTQIRKPDEDEDIDRNGLSCSPEDDGDSSTNPSSGPDDDMGSDGNTDDD